MNIAAYMAALDIDGLDHYAKHAVQVVAGRASRQTSLAAVSVSRVATDMGVNRTTATRALARAVTAGYLSVDKWPGKRSVWRVNLVTVSPPTCGADAHDVVTGSPPPDAPGWATKDSWRRSRRSAGEKQGANGAVENPQPADNWQPDLPPNPMVYDEATGTVTYVK